MDASLEQDHCDVGNNTSSVQTRTETNHESGCQSACNEPLKQTDYIVNEKDQFRNIEGGSSSPVQATLEQNHELCSGDVHVAYTELKQEVGFESVKNVATETRILEQLNVQSEYVTVKSPSEQLVSLPAEVTIDSSSEQMGSLPDASSGNPCAENLGPSPEDEAMNPRRLGRAGKRTSARKGKQSLKSSVESTRVLRSREKAKAPEPSNAFVSHATIEEKKRKKKKENHQKGPVNEFSKIRNHLRYLLNKINYEQSLIDAYAGEGWKGQSLEKVKLEKELERARSEMLLRKLKIRELFQRLDLSCAEGRIPESLFDSEGEIDCDDIFCAKCGLKDLSLDNDIILCDGACERGFHQFCLQPPLSKEDIPPDDEGWLCPGCDCKVDCTSLLNDSLGTNISITDSWEKVFPEAAVAATGNKLDDDLGLSSDDSQDDDYDPDGLEVDEKAEGDEQCSDADGDEQSSDESDFYSASDDFVPSPKNDQYLGLPSDDSEDDDYNPDANAPDDHVKQENSSSDFTSDSEDFDAAVDGKNFSGDDEGPKHSNRKISRLSGTKLQPLNEELSSLLESDSAQADSTSVIGRRHVERLDYKKLHDETYGNVSTESSDDEEWVDTAGPKKRRTNDGKAVLVSPNGNSENAEDTSHVTPKRKGRKKLGAEGRNDSPDVSHQGSAEPGSGGKSTTKSAHKKLGETVKQMLFKSFKENEYPDRAAKEKLANEFGITTRQVSKWFENARWSFRHNTSRMKSYTTESAPNNGSQSALSNKEVPEPKPIASPSSGVEAQNLVTPKRHDQKSGSPRHSKKKGKVDHEALECSPKIEPLPKPSPRVKCLETSETRKSGRIRRKSVA